MTIIQIGIIVLSGISLFFLGKFIGTVRQRRKMKDILLKGTGRFGIIEKKSYLADSPFIIEIEEIEEAGAYTKVRIIELIKPVGCSSSTHDLLKSINYKDWVTTVSITWYNNNSQKIRDNKINQILGTKNENLQ